MFHLLAAFSTSVVQEHDEVEALAIPKISVVAAAGERGKGTIPLAQRWLCHPDFKSQ